MKVRCVSEQPNELQLRQLGSDYTPGKTVYPVVFGQEYTVYGIGAWDGVLWLEIEMQRDVVVTVPLFLFEIVDGKPSRLWEARVHEDGAFTLWPPSFYEEAYHDRLSDGKAPEVDDFRSIKQKLEVEELSEML